MTRIAICVPSRDTVHAGFALSLAKTVSHLTQQSIEHTILINLGTVLPQQRNTLVDEALEWGATHIFWLDSDMYVPHDAVTQLLSHNKEIVAAAYSTRVPPFNITAFCDPDNLDCRLDARTGIHQVWAVAMGCMLVDTQIYKFLGKPWHQYVYNNDTQDLSGEDIYFCKTANDAGIDVYVDADLSQKISHYGTKAFRLSDIQ